MLVISLILYLITLKGCPSQSMMECVPLIVPLIPQGLLVLWFSSLLSVIAFKLVLNGVAHRRFHILIALKLVFIWTVSQGSTFQNHGVFNKSLFIIFLIFNMISITFLQYIYVLYKRYPLYTIFFSILIILIVSIKIDALWARGSWTRG